MSIRDRDLLRSADISASDVATLLQRSRQAIYQGLSHERDYFSAQDAMVLLHDAKRRDSRRFDDLLKFIADTFPTQESELILPDRISQEKLNCALGKAEAAILVFNGDIAHLMDNPTLSTILCNLLRTNQPINTVGFIVPAEWVLGYIGQELALPLPKYVIDEDVSFLPSFALVSSAGIERAFVFVKVAAEELNPMEAKRLWQHFAPRFPGNIPYTERLTQDKEQRRGTSRRR